LFESDEQAASSDSTIRIAAIPMELTRPEFRVLAKCDNSPLFSAAHRGARLAVFMASFLT
jgi:hypothetical protein